jgi:DNA-binding NarL/FixJ family response regulator
MTGEHDPAGERPAGHSPTVVIADDQALVRGGFRLILKAAGIDVVAEAADGAQAVAAARAHRPDVVLMDIRMPVMDGIEATRQILADAPPGDTDGGGPPTRIIILTTFDLDAYVYAALTAGASGFLLKDVTPEHLVAAVQLVRTGDALLAPSITRRLVERFAATSGRAGLPHGATNLVRPSEPGEPQSRQPGPGQLRGTAPRPGLGLSAEAGRRPGTPGGDAASALTPRELEVLGLVARGMSNAEIAAALILAEATVKTHVARILTKLGLRDRVQAVVLAYETGLVFPAGTAD